MNKTALNHSLEFIRSWLEFRHGRSDIPGYAVAIAYKGEIILNEAYGYADLETRQKLTTDHLFRVASQSKTFTATAILQLQEQGKLRIDDYVVTYLPWLTQHEDERWQRITMRQILSHSAGISRDGDDDDFWQLERPFPDDETYRTAILASKLVYDNNTKLKYSNFGYPLLGYVVEAASGETYSTFVTKHIIEPLGLTNTGPDYVYDIRGKLATGYSRKDYDRQRLPVPVDTSTFAFSPVTGFYTNAADLCQYFAAHFIGSGKLLDDESKKEMQRTQWHARLSSPHDHRDYGLGMSIEYPGERRTIGHAGGYPGHATKSMADPEDELVVVVLTNCIDGPTSSITKGIYGIIDYFQQYTPASAPTHDLSHLEGRYMCLWGLMDIVVTGDKVVDTYPDTWEPLTRPQELEYVDDTTLKLKYVNSFNSGGELVRFNLKDTEVETVVYAGMTMWPQDAWLKRRPASA